jgi:hypothetical protein
MVFKNIAISHCGIKAVCIEQSQREIDQFMENSQAITFGRFAGDVANLLKKGNPLPLFSMIQGCHTKLG